jgi:uncharacterized protein
LYAYAEREGIPLIYHCTRVGSQYIGSNIEDLIPANPEMIMPDPEHPGHAVAMAARDEINARIERYRARGWIRNSGLGVNDHACDLFSHPQNYVPVMLKFPKLKICLAHMGGATEVSFMDPELPDERGRMAATHRKYHRLKKTWAIDGYNWAALIRDLMVKHENLYTDLSYTVADLDSLLVRTNIGRWLATRDLTTAISLTESCSAPTFSWWKPPKVRHPSTR